MVGFRVGVGGMGGCILKISNINSLANKLNSFGNCGKRVRKKRERNKNKYFKKLPKLKFY
jgi:hypothetical protein